jgi:hypothetical protein
MRIQGTIAVDLAQAGVPLFITPASVEAVLAKGSLETIRILYRVLGKNFAIKGPDGEWLPFSKPLTEIVQRRTSDVVEWFFTSGIVVADKVIRIFQRNDTQLTEGLCNVAAAEVLWPILEQWRRFHALKAWQSFAINTGDLELFKWCEPKLYEDEWQLAAINTAVKSEQVSVARYLYDKYYIGADSSSILEFIKTGRVETLDAMRPFITGEIDREDMYDHALLSNDTNTLQWVYNFAGKPRAFYLSACSDLHKKAPEVIEWVFQKKLVTAKTEFARPIGAAHMPFYDRAIKAGCPESILFQDDFLSVMCQQGYSRELLEYVLAHGVARQKLALIAARFDNLNVLQDLFELGYRADEQFRKAVRATGCVNVKAWLFDHE